MSIINNINKIQLLFLIILFPAIIPKYSILINSICKSKINYNPENPSDISKFLLEILHGKIPLNLSLDYLSNYDFNIIKKINLNIECPYIVYDNNTESSLGIFLGAGINLKLYNYSEFYKILSKKNFEDKNKYLNLLKTLDNIDLNNLNESFLNEYETQFKNIDIFNELVINYTIDKIIINNNIFQEYKTPLFNTLLALYLQQIITEDDFINYLNYNSLDLSYIIEHLIELFPYTRFIQSKLINLYDANFKYNYNHIFVVIEKNIFLQDELDNIKLFIRNLYQKIINNNIYSTNRISILIKNENNYTYIINYEESKDNLDNILKNDKKSDIIINLSEIYLNINKKYEENKKDIYENKIVILLLNSDSKFSDNKDPNILLEKYKKEYQIQTIPIINTENNNDNNKDIFEFNIFYNFTEKINIQNILLSISNMHIPINLNINNDTSILVSNIKINDIDTPLYFEIYTENNTNNNNKTEYYEISLDIISSSGYNIFISNNNSYPNIKNHLNNFMKYHNNTKPIIRIIKSKDIIEKNKFYFSIEGNLFFNINITKKIFEGNDINKLILSSGEYDFINYDVSYNNKIIKTITDLTTFGENFTLNYYTIFKEISNENMIKYFTRGIDVYNTEYNSFFNYNLFLYLYGNNLINRVYKDKNNNYYIGIDIKLKEYTPYKLKKAGFDKYTINKLYLFLNTTNYLKSQAPSVIFTPEEIKKIYNITFKKYIQDLTSRINKYQNCLNFEEQNPTMKFILFCLFFSYHNDNTIFKIIINLSLKIPDYSLALNLLNQYEKNTGNIFLLNLIKREEQDDKSEKIMTNILLGKSLFLSNIGKNFISEYYNIMSKTKTKISLSIYDTYNKKIETIISFSSNNNYPKVEDIINNYEDERYLYNKTQKMDFELINKFSEELFNHYDKGIKKILILLCDEKLEDNGYIINNELIITNNYKESKNKYLMKQKQINLILLTSKNYEKGFTHDLFKLYSENKDNTYNIYENYFHINNLNNTEIYISDLSRLIKFSSIKIKLGQRLINDFYSSKNSYYEIDCSLYENDVIVIKTNITNFNIYASLSNPFPYYNDINLIEKKNDESIVITKCKDGKAFFSLEPINDIKKEIIEVFSCESYQPDNNCKFVNDKKTLWIVFAILVFGFVLFFTIYKCRYNTTSRINKKNKKRINVFDTDK